MTYIHKPYHKIVAYPARYASALINADYSSTDLDDIDLQRITEIENRDSIISYVGVQYLGYDDAMHERTDMLDYVAETDNQDDDDIQAYQKRCSICDAWYQPDDDDIDLCIACKS